MFEMASLYSRSWPRYAGAIFCILVGCLAMHFLVEDSVLVPELAAAGQAASGGNPQFYDETDHKDDLVMPAKQLARFSPGEARTAFFDLAIHEKLADKPVLPPPKA